ncbi:unnamed protein product, partial [marine sediment metagenome]
GSMPTLMAESRREVDIEVQYEYMGKARGATTVFCVRESPVTFARLSRINGHYVLFAAAALINADVSFSSLSECGEP